MFYVGEGTKQYFARRERIAENMSKEKSSKRDYDGEKLVKGVLGKLGS